MDKQFAILVVVLLLPPPSLADASWFSLSNPQVLPKYQDAGASVTLPFQLSLFETTLPPGGNVWVSPNGYISFGKEVKKFEKLTYPADDVNNDPTLIAPFRARMQYRPDESDSLASVSYSLGLTSNSTSKLNSLIRANIPGASSYSVAHLLAVSWANISFYGGDPSATPYPRNTFQVVICTNGTSTFTVFNYKSLMWTGGHANGGDAKTGVGADNPPAQAGINIGHGKGFINLNNKSNVLDLDVVRGSSTVGQYIYEISKVATAEHTCPGVNSAVQSIELTPSSGHMFGGNPVEVAGACFAPHQAIECQFGDQSVKGLYLSSTRVLCYAPTFYANKQHKFKLKIGGVEVKSNDLYYLSSNGVKAPVDLLDTDNWRSLRPQSNLQLKWDPMTLSPYNGSLNLKIYTYRENASYFSWHEELTIAKNIPNTGSYSFNSSLFRCSTNCRDKILGAVVLELPDTPDSLHPGRLWSKEGPLAWYVNHQLRQDKDGNIWPDRQCYNWFVKETKEGSDWLNELEDCPCTKDQAVADIGRFVPDPSCNIYNKKSSYNCYYHQTAEHCVRSIWPSHPTGAGTQCCYGSDGNLIYAGDSIYGSTVDKSHNDGALPYNAPGLVPGLSHWLLDVITYQYCCLWNSLNDTCNIYMDLRPTKDCKNYQRIKTAAIYGATHVKTLADKSSVKLPSLEGEYSLLKSLNSTDLHIHVQLSAIPGTSSTIVSAVAVKTHNSSQVKVTLNKHDDSLRSKLIIDNVERDFTDPAWYKQEYQGLKVLSWNKKPVTDHSNFTLTLDCGVGIRVTATKHNLDILVTVPESFQNYLNSKSLLGAWEKTADGALLTDAFIMPGHSMFTASDKQTVAAKAYDSQEVTSRAAEFADWMTSLDEYSEPVVSCGMPVFHGNRKGDMYTEGAIVEIRSCRHGYDLVNHTVGQKYTCSNKGMWEPKISAVCIYSGFPEFSSPIKKKTTPTDNNATGSPVKLSSYADAKVRTLSGSSGSAETTSDTREADYGILAAILVTTAVVLFLIIMAGLVHRNRKATKLDQLKYSNVLVKQNQINQEKDDGTWEMYI